jgi:ATP-dependent RNA helicase DeaD
MAAPVPEDRLRPIRIAIAAGPALTRTLEAAIDELAPTSTFVWDPSEARGRRWDGRDPGIRVGAEIDEEPLDLAVAADLPTADALRALQAAAQRVLVLVRPFQLPYVQKLVTSSSSMTLTGEVHRARDWREELQQAVRERIEARSLNENLLALSPLFEDFDPALVAAALVEVAGGGQSDRAATPDIALWAHIRIEAGRRDQLRAGDVVGVLLNAVGLPKDHIGRVDLRDTFSVVEVRAESAEKAVRGLTGVNLKGRAIAPRFDRR